MREGEPQHEEGTAKIHDAQESCLHTTLATAPAARRLAHCTRQAPTMPLQVKRVVGVGVGACFLFSLLPSLFYAVPVFPKVHNHHFHVCPHHQAGSNTCACLLWHGKVRCCWVLLLLMPLSQNEQCPCSPPTVPFLLPYKNSRKKKGHQLKEKQSLLQAQVCGGSGR